MQLLFTINTDNFLKIYLFEKNNSTAFFRGGWSGVGEGEAGLNPKTGYTALSFFGWTVAAMSVAIAKRIADTGQASRAASEWSHRWQTERPED